MGCLSQTCEDLSLKLSQKIKIRLFVVTVESVLLYRSECWTFDKCLQKQLDGCYTRMLRMALNVSWKRLHHTLYYGSQNSEQSTEEEGRLHMLIIFSMILGMKIQIL